MEVPEEVDVFLVFFIGTLGMIILAGGLIVFFMTYQRRLMRKKVELHDIELKYKEELLHSNIEMLELERKRIAKDLHDDIGHVFSTLSWKLRQLQMPANRESNGKLLKDMQELINTGAGSVKTIAYNMVPYGFEIFGVLTAIQHLCDQAAASGLLEINFEHTDELSLVPDTVGLNVYRVLQELISNTLKYAAAGRIDIELAATPGALHITYADNGCGFDAESIKKKKGYGLKNIESRINMLGAVYHYEAAPGKGVKVDIVIPVKD